jgi:hypothetical protein
MGCAVLERRKTADVSVDTLRIFLREEQADRHSCGWINPVTLCDVYYKYFCTEFGLHVRFLATHIIKSAFPALFMICARCFFTETILKFV